MYSQVTFWNNYFEQLLLFCLPNKKVVESLDILFVGKMKVLLVVLCFCGFVYRGKFNKEHWSSLKHI